MPRFYFDIRAGERFTPDQDGVECPGIEEARDTATLALFEMAKDALPGSDRYKIEIQVSDENRELVLTAALVFGAQKVR